MFIKLVQTKIALVD